MFDVMVYFSTEELRQVVDHAVGQVIMKKIYTLEPQLMVTCQPPYSHLLITASFQYLQSAVLLCF